MEVKCPKCRFRFTVNASPGMTELQCNCPRCGTPFTYTVETPEAEAPGADAASTQQETTTTEQSVTHQQEATTNTTDNAGTATPPPYHKPETDQQAWSGTSTPPPAPPHRSQPGFRPTPIRPVSQPPQRKKGGCLRRTVITFLVIVVGIFLLFKACDSCQGSEDTDNGVTLSEPTDNVGATAGINDQPYDSTVGPQKAPKWIQGNWHYKTEYGSIDVNISGDAITESTNGETITGHFKYQNHIIYGDFGSGGSFRYKLVEETHQIDCGDGMLMNKVD